MTLCESCSYRVIPLIALRKEYLDLFQRLHSHGICQGQITYANIHRRAHGSRSLAVCDFDGQCAGYFDKAKYKDLFRKEMDSVIRALSFTRRYVLAALPGHRDS